MDTPRTWRRFAVALVLALALGLAPVAPVAAAPFFVTDLLAAPAGLWARAWGFFAPGWMKEGSSIDPNGTPRAAGGSTDPVGSPTEEGGSIDPDG